MPDAPRRLHVLTADGDPLVRWSVNETLIDAGHDVVGASDGSTLLHALTTATRPFDVVLLDAQLTGPDDLALLPRIRQHSPVTAVVLMIEFATPDAAAHALSLGACHVMKKPFDMHDIEGVLRAARAHDHSIECGDHVCAMLSSVHEQANLAADWIATGLGRNERCWYVAAADESAAVQEALAARQIACDAEIRRGAFNIVPASAAYLVDGVFDPVRTMQIFSDTVNQAVRDGFSGFRAVADMSWALTLPDAAAQVITYEALLKSMFATHRVTGLCLYHRDRMPAELLSGALSTHPIAGAGGRYSRNSLYDPHVSGSVLR